MKGKGVKGKTGLHDRSETAGVLKFKHKNYSAELKLKLIISQRQEFVQDI